ncbi:uncharacterized protein LOC131153800 [Malania oleifera]|uniref:uncharacterized protein LOC131153800 n=1 Tax=Malania oleifera TaxID=397392 RepID=UPI0025AE54CB|nr:uncharacterized protein LOC131153800 [Malania oleifera]
MRDEDRLPSQPLVNPKGQYEIEYESVVGPSSYHEQAQAITIMRSGREVNNTVGEKLSKGKGKDKIMVEPNFESCIPSSSNPMRNPEILTPSVEGSLPHYVPPTPYPAALQAHSKPKKEEIEESMMDTFRQVKINLPLLDVIKQMSAYAKFLKDLCTQKRKSKVHLNKRVRLTENVSLILLGSIPPKFKDPSAATISCVISNFTIDKALLDLGANMEPTDRTKKKISVLLGHPFLATANACIQCRTDVMDISFGNMQLWLNVFCASQNPSYDISCDDVDMIDEGVEKDAPSTLLKNFLEDRPPFDRPSTSSLEDPCVHVSAIRESTSTLKKNALES